MFSCSHPPLDIASYVRYVLKGKSRQAFLSYLRLSIYMAIVSVAITVSFHIYRTPSELERQVAKPLGAVFWVLSVVTLAVGAGNYISEHLPSFLFFSSFLPLHLFSLLLFLGKLGLVRLILIRRVVVGTVNLYGRRAAIVQSGWKTQIVSLAVAEQKLRCVLTPTSQVLGIIAVSIIGTCIILLVIDKVRQR